MSLSLRVLREDPKLLVFPAAAVAAGLALWALCLALSSADFGGAHHALRVIVLAGVVAFYPVTFACAFCGVALAAVLAARLDGEGATVARGWRCARERAGVIAGWALLVCTLGAAMRLPEEHVPQLPRVPVALVGLSWTLASLLAAPLLVYEDLGPIGTLERAAALFRRRWAEQATATAGVGVGAGWLLVPFAVIVLIGVALGQGTGLLLAAAGGAGILVVLAVQTSLEHVFRLFVYRHATGLDEGEILRFPREDLERPFVPRRGLFGRARTRAAA